MRFVLRSISAELKPETAFDDLKAILDFLVTADRPLAEAVAL